MGVVRRTGTMRLAWFLVLVAACGDNPSVPPDTGPTADGAIDAAVDAPVDAAPDAPAGCGTLATDPSDVFVDHAATGDSVGTASCPFHTIRDAIVLAAPAAPRTIHVAAGDYTETAIVAIRPLETLAGAGEAAVMIDGGGTCAITATACTVTVAGGGALRGATITNTTGDAVVVTGGTGAATIDHVSAANAKRFGFAIRGAVQLDHVTASGNGLDGLNAKMATVTITSSDFKNNSENGLDIDQGATLAYTGGLLNGNQGDAIFLHNGSSFTALAHQLAGLSIVQNLGFGIFCASNASCRIRNTTMFGNEVGVVFDVGTANALDVGTAASPGGNLFAGPQVTDRNVRAGLCFEQSGATQTQLVEGDTWRACPPPAKKIGPFCRSNNVYSDIAFVPAVATSGSPVIAPTACSVSP